MKKLVCLALMGIMAASVVTGQSLLKNLKNVADSAKEVSEGTKKIANATGSVSSKKKSAESTAKTSANEMKILDSEGAFYIYMNLSGTKMTEDLYVDYVKVAENAIYTKYKDDEFEWQDKLAEQKKLCDERIDAADVDSVYTMSTKIEFGDYDFQNEGYKVTIGDGTYFPFDSIQNTKHSWESLSFKSPFKKQIALKLNNFSKYNFFAMPKDTAKAFLQGRKDRYGDVNRKVMAVVKFEIESFNSNDYKNWEKLAKSNDYLPLLGAIQAVEIYDTDNGKFEKIGDLIIK